MVFKVGWGDPCGVLKKDSRGPKLNGEAIVHTLTPSGNHKMIKNLSLFWSKVDFRDHRMWDRM